ncbi:translesion error-prone DNA polymerase V autoproteolytic subunit [Alcaligenaceae bacterium 429]|nr:translesion error-prone DNA polymerase V autoproteolytic subunit [Alcaligenaceae bacterium 429]
MDSPAPLSSTPTPVRIMNSTVQCGFPSPAGDYDHKTLSITDLLIHQADATYFMRVRGPSMRDAGIDDGDYVVIDRSIEPRHGHIVLAVVDGEFTIKQLYQQQRHVKLLAANPAFHDIEFKDGQELSVWGVVTWTLKNHVHA